MIAVTGATGHIGNVLVRKLLARGETVRAIVPPFEDIKPLEGLEVEIVEGDVRDADSLTKAFRSAEIVYHLAGIVTISSGNDDFLYQVNVEGTKNVVNSCLKNNVKRMVYVSSVHALKEPPHGTVIDETCDYDPECTRGSYDRSKALASLEVIKGIDKNLDSVLVCPSGVIGPYDYRISQMGHLFINFMKGDLKARVDGAYDFVDVRDVAEGIILACKKGKCGESYVLAGEQISVQDLFLELEKLTGIKAPSLKVPLWLVNVVSKVSPLYYKVTGKEPLFTTYSIDVINSNSKISSNKAFNELGYFPRPIKESIKDSVEWIRKNIEF
ncbi:SDR family oxidoreductase [Methanobacterium sp.]|uniref:SDR family oxidoreductase n=1 Tax=Methanobacterium sp. TaxID=2164 RepID=UPI0031589005